MNAARRWMLVTAHFLCPLLFFTNLTRNPYVTQIAALNLAIALAIAAWAWTEAERPDAARLPRSPVECPLAAFVLVWAASWLRAYLGHAEFFKPSMLAEGARNGAFLLVNAVGAYWLGVSASRDDDGTTDVPLGKWAAFAIVWGLLWTLFPSVHARAGGRAEDIFAQAWDPYGAILWAAGLGGAYALCRRGRLTDYLHLAFAASFLASVYGVGQYFNHEFVWPNVLNPYGGRAVSTFGNPNFLSTYNASLLPSVLALFLVEKSSARRWTYGVLFLSMVAALLATLTRSSWGGAAVGLAALSMSPRLRERVKAEPRTLGLLLGSSLAMALAWPSSTISAGYAPSFLGRLTEFKPMAARDGYYSPFHQRVLIWTSGWLMGSESPLLGKGGGLFELFYPFYQGHLLHQFKFFHNMRTHANNSHNEIVEVFAQTGILGLGAAVWLWTTFFATAVKWTKGKAGEEPLWVGAVAGAAAVLADNMLNVSMHFAVPAFMFWWLVGTAMGRGDRDAAAPRAWAAEPAVRRAGAALLTALALWASWYQVRFWEREVWYFAGFKLIRQGNFPAATAALTRSRAWGPPEVNAIYELGNVYARSGRPAEAAEAYLGALKANAGYDEIYFNLGTITSAQLGDPVKGRAFYETAWALNPLSNDIINALVAVYLRDPQKNKAAAEALLTEATGIFPENPNHWNNLGYLYTLDSRWTEALAAYARALALAPDNETVERNLQGVVARGGLKVPEILTDLAELRRVDKDAGRGDWSAKNMEAAGRIVARRPELLKARFLYGTLLLANRHPAEAAVELERVVAVDPRRSAVRLNLANAYISLGRAGDAAAQYKAVLAVEPNNALALQRLNALGGGR